MSVQEIPLLTDDPSYDVDVELDGTTYSLRLSWNVRADMWIMDMYLPTNAARIPVVLGQPCLLGLLLTLGTYLNAPPGQIAIIGDRDPARNDWGTRAKMVYLDQAEIENLTNG